MKFSLSTVALFAFVALVHSTPLPQEEVAAQPNRPIMNFLSSATSAVNSAIDTTADTAFSALRGTASTIASFVGNTAQAMSNGMNTGATTFGNLITAPFQSSAAAAPAVAEASD